NPASHLARHLAPARQVSPRAQALEHRMLARVSRVTWQHGKWYTRVRQGGTAWHRVTGGRDRTASPGRGTRASQDGLAALHGWQLCRRAKLWALQAGQSQSPGRNGGRGGAGGGGGTAGGPPP